MTSEEIFACARKVGLIEKSEAGDWFVRPDAEVKEVFQFANLISVVESLIRSKTDEARAIVREKESDLNHKEIERLRDLSYDRLNKMNSLRVTNQMLKRIQKLTEAEKDKEIERLRDLVKAEREACLALVNQGTGEATSAAALKILRMERDRISAAIRARGEVCANPE